MTFLHRASGLLLPLAATVLAGLASMLASGGRRREAAMLVTATTLAALVAYWFGLWAAFARAGVPGARLVPAALALPALPLVAGGALGIAAGTLARRRARGMLLGLVPLAAFLLTTAAYWLAFGWLVPALTAKTP